MNCTHQSTLTYELTSADQIDLNQRLWDVLFSGEHEFERMFLTPNIRDHRARFMLASTKSSLPITETKLVDSMNEEACEP